MLLLNELPEFPRSVLEALRQPIEDGVVSVARVGGRSLFPARFRLVATINLSFRCAAIRPDPGGYHRLNPHQRARSRRRPSPGHSGICEVPT